LLCFISFYLSRHLRFLLSFPTRRSSDLINFLHCRRFDTTNQFRTFHVAHIHATRRTYRLKNELALPSNGGAFLCTKKRLYTSTCINVLNFIGSTIYGVGGKNPLAPFFSIKIENK